LNSIRTGPEGLVASPQQQRGGQSPRFFVLQCPMRFADHPDLTAGIRFVAAAAMQHAADRPFRQFAASRFA
jgi:hypothetical protein